MDPGASIELMESIFGNELLLENIFSWMDLETIKMVRLVNTKWKREAGPRFAEISLVLVHLKHEVVDRTTLQVTLYLNKQPFHTLAFHEDIKAALNDRLASFRNFKLQFSTSRETIDKNEMIEGAYFNLNQLVQHLWRPNGSLIHSLSILWTIRSTQKSNNLLASIIEGCNAFWNVEIDPKGFVFTLDTSNLPKMSCHTLKISHTKFSLEDASNFFSNFVNTRKIILDDPWLIHLDTVVRAIVENKEQFKNLEEIDIKIMTKLEQIRVLAKISGLKRLRVRNKDEEASGNAMTALEECITRHASTLELLDLDFSKRNSMWTELCGLETLEFPNLKRFYLKTNVRFGIALARSVDLWGLGRSMQNGTFRKRFPSLKTVEIVGPSEMDFPCLSPVNISEFLPKYGIQICGTLGH